MKSIIKKYFRRFIRWKFGEAFAADFMTDWQVLQFFFMQKVLGINRKVPWPVHWSSIVSSPHKIHRKSFRPLPGFMPGQYIQATNEIHIGKNVRLGPGVKIISASHNLCNYDKHDAANPISIGDNCWLAANVVLLPGVKLGNHVVVAAGAVVTKNFSDDCLIAGVPAKIIRILDEYK